MDPVPGPSERLCEVGLDLATRLNLYEEAGGTSHLEDVIATPAFEEVFDGTASVIGRPRPSWRWEVRLRQGRDVETIIGHTNGHWSVEGLDMLASSAPLEGSCVVVIEPHGSDVGFKRPPAETTPSTDVISSQVPAYDSFVFVRSLVALGMRKAIAHRPPRWHPDPGGRYRYRYWNGARWTRFVLDTDSLAPRWDESLDWGKRLRLPKW